MTDSDSARIEDAEAANLELERFWHRFASAFAHPFTANGALSEFVRNTAVTGAYAEAWVRWAARVMLPHLRVSTGAIIRTSDAVWHSDLSQVPQLDLILWDPTELPPLFEQGDFALVHTQSARGLIEVKRTLDSEQNTRDQLRKQKARLLPEYRGNVLCVVVSHPKPLFRGHVHPGWPADKNRVEELALTRLLDESTSAPDPNGVFALIYLLSHVARAAPPRTAA